MDITHVEPSSAMDQLGDPVDANYVSLGDDDLPPGTLCLELILERKQGKIILHPVPTNDPNDPLNWPKWYKAINFGLVCFYTLMIFVSLVACAYLKLADHDRSTWTSVP